MLTTDSFLGVLALTSSNVPLLGKPEKRTLVPSSITRLKCLQTEQNTNVSK